MAANPPPETKPAGRLRAFAWSETKRLVRDSWGAFWRTAAYLSPVLLILGGVFLFLSRDPNAPWYDHLLVFAILVGYVVVWAFWLGVTAMTVRIVWRILGRAVLLPLVAVPLSVVLCLWLARGGIAAVAGDVGQAFEQSVEAHGIEKPQGALHMGGGPFLVLLLPTLLMHYAPAIFDPAVLGQLALLLLFLALVILAGAIPATLGSLAILSRSLWRRWRERYQEFLAESARVG